MYLNANGSATVISTQSVYRPVRFFSTGSVRGFTFKADSTGAITAFADAGSGKVTVTSNGHGLLDGEVVGIQGTTSYNGVFVISGKTDNTFNITATWVANDATGNWYLGSTLKANAGSAGMYNCQWNSSFSTASNSQVMQIAVFSNATAQLSTTVQRKTGTGGDVGACGGNGIITVADGDYILLCAQNTTSASNATFAYGNLVLTRIS